MGPELIHLEKGDRIKLTADGPERVITRVTDAAAYYDVPVEKTFEVFDTKKGEHREITRTSRKVDYISAYASVVVVELAPRARRVRVDN